MEKVKKVKIKPSLCWSCKNAVPKIRNGKYICGCSWSKDFQPVEGWTAEKDVKGENGGNRMESWNVLDCPEYEKDVPDGSICTDDISDDTYVSVAERMLESQMHRYRNALEKYARYCRKKDLYKVKRIEKELLTPYYAALALGKVDFRDIIRQCRENAGVKIEDFEVEGNHE